MSLRFFCDQCVPRAIADSLLQIGCDVLLLRDHLPARAPDGDVIAKAQEFDSVLVSLNGDFANIVTYRPAAYVGIVAIQLHDHPETIPALMAGLSRFISEHPYADDYRGKLLIVEPHRIRIRS